MSARRLAPALVAVTLAACQADKAVAPETGHLHPAAVKLAEVSQSDLNKLRRAVAPYQKLRDAKAAGWRFIIPNLDGSLCFTKPNAAMGFHFADTKLIGDGVVDIKHPEALIFEPQAGGGMRFVGVEYLVPIDLWNQPNPPRLFGREFAVVQGFGVYGLHVWIERENPRGLFAPWNPDVSCEFAD